MAYSLQLSCLSSVFSSNYSIITRDHSLRDGPRPTRESPSHKKLFRYALTFALLFYVHLVHFLLLCRIHKEFLLARVFINFLHKKYEKRHEKCDSYA
jgi:hypothetical protein